ncbi:hypothetical protein DFH11DRAFT_307424 [Phellopilus nigrolimitatus]|nr:hypothetical protein DFH11DRAFT_307424 [Phellopilus nigrolimitatus]
MAPRRPSTNPPNPSVTDSPGRPSRAAKDKVINEKPWFTELQKRKRAQSTASSTPAESSTAKPAAKKAKNTKQKEERAARQFIARGLDDPAEASQLSAVAPPPPTNGAARNAFSDISTTRENALTTQKMRPAGKSRGNGPKQPADKSIMHAPRMDEHRTIVAPLNTQSSRSGVDEHGTIARNLAGHSLDSRNTSLSHHASTQEASPAPRMDEHRMTGNPTSTLSARRDIDGHGAVARNLAGHSLDAREPPIPRRASAREGLPAPRMDEHRTIGAPLGTQSARRDIDEHGTAARNLAGCTPETREPTLPHRASARDGLAAPRMDEHRTIVAPLNTQPARSDINEHGATLSGRDRCNFHTPSHYRQFDKRAAQSTTSASCRHSQKSECSRCSD